jgi:hypothetical protein
MDKRLPSLSARASQAMQAESPERRSAKYGLVLHVLGGESERGTNGGRRGSCTWGWFYGVNHGFGMSRAAMRWRGTGPSTPNRLRRPSSRVAISSCAPSPRAETGLLPYVCGSVSFRRLYVLRAYFVQFPCTSSARMITFARKSIPGPSERFIRPSISTSTRRHAQGCPRAGRAPCLRSLGRTRRQSPPQGT